MSNETTMRPDFHINPDDYPEDVAAEAEIRADERERCCKDICGMCHRDLPVHHRRDRHRDRWYHLPLDGGKFNCDAERIRERAFKESESR